MSCVSHCCECGKLFTEESGISVNAVCKECEFDNDNNVPVQTWLDETDQIDEVYDHERRIRRMRSSKANCG